MGYLQKLKQLETEVRPNAQVEDTPDTNHSEVDANKIAGLSLTEFKKRDLAVQIYSDVLGREVWFCSNQEMVEQIRRDDPQAIIYLGSELEELLSKNLTSEDLKRVHAVKAVFKKSGILRTNDKGGK